MNTAELAAVRPRLERFTAEMFAPLVQADHGTRGPFDLDGEARHDPARIAASD